MSPAPRAGGPLPPLPREPDRRDLRHGLRGGARARGRRGPPRPPRGGLRRRHDPRGVEGPARGGPQPRPDPPHAEPLAEADTLILTHPTWWFGQPAMLEGRPERIMVPGFAFAGPDAASGPRPGPAHIRRIGVFRTCGVSRPTPRLVGPPNRRGLLRGLLADSHPGARTRHHALCETASAHRERCAVFLDRIPARIDRLLGASYRGPPAARPAPARRGRARRERGAMDRSAVGPRATGPGARAPPPRDSAIMSSRVMPKGVDEHAVHSLDAAQPLDRVRGPREPRGGAPLRRQRPQGVEERRPAR